MTSLSNNQKLFCQEYLKLGMNGTQAYLNVYKTCKKEETAMASASRLLRNVKVKEYIEELQSKVEEKAIVSIEDIVKELTAIAFTDRTKISKMVTKEKQLEKTTLVYKAVDFPDTDTLDNETKKVIAGYKQTQSGLAVETYDKMKALELLGKYLGMFKDEAPTINNNIVNPYANLSEEELRKLVGD
ncbi:MAG: terminase small subunit [Mycoplasmatota bacterium]|jgi:phage terminase small subunit|nr:terminase small subunit [Mycoplasmatota bacterium]